MGIMRGSMANGREVNKNERHGGETQLNSAGFV